MKELMVTLLVLSCTGMVWAQQDNSNGFRASSGTSGGNAFGRSSDPESTAQMVPIVNDDSQGARRTQIGQGIDRGDGNTRVRNSFSTPQPNERTSAASETSRILGRDRSSLDRFQTGSTGGATPNSNRISGSNIPPLYLGLPRAAMNVLLTNGRVVAPVKDPYVDRIKISDQSTPKAGPTRTIRPKLIGESLVFTFTQDDVDFTHEGSFEFEVPAYMKNKYTSATIEIPEVLARVAQQTGPAPRISSGFHSDDNRWTLPGDTNVREPIRRNDPRANNQPTETERDRLQRLDYEKYLREKEAREKTTLANQNRQLLDELARIRYEDQQRQAAARVQPQQPIVYPRDDRYAQNIQFDQRQPIVSRPVVPPASMDTVSYKMMQDMAQMKARVAQLGDENRRLNNNIQNVKADRDELLRGRFDFSNDTRNDLVQDRSRTPGVNDRLAGKPPVQNRPAMSVGDIGDPNRNGVKSGAGGITTGQATNPNSKSSWELLMFLMLLLSVGLNLYLWALSRGFYMRYQELADELRETFTVTA